MSIELKPCPFCGGECSPDSVVRYSESHAKEQGWAQTEFYYCNCIRCGADNKGIIGHKTRDKAIAAWNRRAPSPSPAPGVVEAARNFMLLFVDDGVDPPALTLDVDPNELANRYDALSIALASLSQPAKGEQP